MRRSGRKRRLARDFPTLVWWAQNEPPPWVAMVVLLGSSFLHTRSINALRVPSRGPGFAHFSRSSCHHSLTHTSHGVSGFRTRESRCGDKRVLQSRPFGCSRAIEVRDDRTNRSGGRGRGPSLRMWLGVRPCSGFAHSDRRCRNQATRRDPKLRPRGSCESHDRSLRERRAGSRGPHALRHCPRPTSHGCG